MRIVNLTANPNGSHTCIEGDFIREVPTGWAMILEGFAVPSSFPFVDIEAEEVTHYRSKQAMGDSEDTLVPYTAMTVTVMMEKEVPEAPVVETEPTEVEQLRADVDYIAIMTGVEL